MKKACYAVLAASFLLQSSCTRQAPKEKEGRKTAVAAAAEAPEKGADALGEWQVRVYEGVLPPAGGGGIRYTLTVSNREFSGDGTFSLVRTYPGANGEKGESFECAGKRLTLRGTKDDNDATVWQFVSDDGKETFNLLYENEQTLTLLDDRQAKIPSDLNYSLKLKTKQAGE